MSYSNRLGPKNLLNRYDVLLITIIFSLAIFSFLFLSLYPKIPADTVRITIGDDQTYHLNLQTDGIYTFEAPLGEVVVEIRQHKVRMLRSSCPNQYCVRQGFLEQTGNSIVCVPNMTTIEVIGRQPYDGVSR